MKACLFSAQSTDTWLLFHGKNQQYMHMMFVATTNSERGQGGYHE